jgi:hypothetical protein
MGSRMRFARHRYTYKNIAQEFNIGGPNPRISLPDHGLLKMEYSRSREAKEPKIEF